MTALTAEDLMTKDVLTSKADWSVDRLADFFVDNGISGAPVLSPQGRLVGVVSSSDLVRQQSQPTRGADTLPAHSYYVGALEGAYSSEDLSRISMQQDSTASVRDIMTPMIFTVFPSTSVQEVADAMLKGRIHRVFVAEDGRLVGVISALDLLGLVRDS